MKIRLKKILAILMTITMCMTTIDMRVFAEENVTTEQVQEAVASGDAVMPENGTEKEPESEVTQEKTTTQEKETVSENVTEAIAGTEEAAVADEKTDKVEKNEGSWDGVTTESVYETEKCRVTFYLTGHWNNGYNAKIKIENISDSVIENWYLSYDFGNTISNIWSAEIHNQENGTYIIKNAGWNQDIAVGESVEFGFGGDENFIGFPDEYELSGENTEAAKDDYTVEYKLTDDWGTGFTGSIIITNHTDSTIEDWVLEFDFDREITNVWNAVIESGEENHYVIKNAGYNSNIKAGSTVNFGFNGIKGTADNVPSNYNLYSYKMNTGYKVTFEAGLEGVTNVPEAQKVKKGEYATKPDAPSKENYLFMGWYSDQTYTEYFDFENTEINSNITLYARWFDILCEADMDEDGLSDSFEELIGTNKNNADTDEDGLSDYLEIDKLNMDPLLLDTDGNGIVDGDEDFDCDGLTNKEELIYGTNLLLGDTDEDLLSDSEEIKIYNTNPLLIDTDNDALTDKSEVRLDTDPNISDTDGNGIKDGDEYYEQEILEENYETSLFTNNIAKPVLIVTAQGDVNNNIEVTEYIGHLKGGEREYVGKALEVRNSSMESGNLTFALSEEYKIKEYSYGTVSTNGLIICFNDGENTYPLESDFNEKSNTLSAEMRGDGIYFVLNVVEWIESYGIDVNALIDTSTNGTTDLKARVGYAMTRTASTEDEDVSIASVKVKGQVDIVFVIDTTGSMSSYIRNVKNNIVAFVDALEEANIKPNFALVEYRDISVDGSNSTNTKENEGDGSNWFKTAEEFKEEIEALGVNGGGDAPETAIDALEMARLLDMRASSQKFFILVTDAGYKVDNNYGIESMDEMINLLVADDINTSVVSGVSHSSTYKDLYEKTGGVFANVGGNFKNELLGIAENITNNTNNGYWIALDGLIPQIVKLDEKPSPTGTADTDKDGLLDREELKSTTSFKKFNPLDYFLGLGLPTVIDGQIIYVYEYYSNPASEDTDKDGLLDGSTIYNGTVEVAPKDPSPLITNGPRGVWKNHIKQQLTGVVATQYSDDYGLDIAKLSELIRDGIDEDIPNDQEIADSIVKKILEIRNSIDFNQKYLRTLLLLIKQFCNGEAATVAGAYILNFVYDAEGVAYHSRPETWQRNFGYNDIYDEFFRIGSNMHHESFEFSTNNEDYVLWMWKGDYWNLHSGAEIGLYTAPKTHFETKHYDAIDFEVPMTLSLYNYYGEYSIDTVFNWVPVEDDQWWITGFSGQNDDFMKPNPNVMVVVGSVELSEGMYNALREAKESYKENDTKVDFEKYLLFDDDSYTVWVCWYEGVM